MKGAIREASSAIRHASSAVTALVRALKTPASGGDPAPAARAQTAWAVGQIGPGADEAIPALTAALQDGDEAVRRAAAEALKRIQGHEGDPIEH